MLMKTTLRDIVIPVLLAVTIAACSSQDVTQYVDPNIGSIAPLLEPKVPTVHRPNSMARVYPVTKRKLNDRYLSDRIYGLAVNMPAYRGGYVTEIMPTTGSIVTDRNAAASVYDHDFEEVHPWYHKVVLEDYDITADWTTTEQAVIYRFVFPADKQGNVIFHADPDEKSSFRITGKNVVQGWEMFHNMKQYFYAEFSQPFIKAGWFDINNKLKGPDNTNDTITGAYVSFDKTTIPVEVRIGISYIDEHQAADNLKQETAGKNFEDIKNDGHSIWENALGKIQVEGGTERQRRIFYTSLYRCMERMVDISEGSRYYSGYDKKVHTDTVRNFYVDDWLWDTFRALHPLMLILNPSQQGDMVNSYVTMYEQGGWMPSFPQVYGDTPPMIGFHSAALVWDTYLNGVRSFDAEKAYEGLKKNAMEGTMVPWNMGGMCALDSFYHKNGYFPALSENDVETEPTVGPFEKRQAVSVTLEHSYDDWCLAQFAKALGKDEDYNFFMKRSQNYKNLFNPAAGFFQPKLANGQWVEPFDPILSAGYGSRMYYTENNAWTWNFGVQHDIPGLIELLGGKEKFIHRVDSIFNVAPRSKWLFMGQFPDATGLNGMFVAGNEPSMHIPYLYNYAGEPWRTQRRIREVLDTWFDDKPLGIPGDEDGGGLCSWYVFSAMGFFPVTVGSGEYAIGSPFFEKITIELPGGKTFTVNAKNCSKKNKYIQSAELNGKPLERAFIKHDDIMAGGELNFVMGDRPNKNWGK